MNVVLPPDLEEYVKALVGTGGYAETSDVIQEALRHHRVNRPSFHIVMTPELERLLDEAMEDVDEAKTTEQLRRRE